MAREYGMKVIKIFFKKTAKEKFLANKKYSLIITKIKYIQNKNKTNIKMIDYSLSR